MRLLFQQQGNVPNASQAFGTTLATRLAWRSALSSDGLTLVSSTGNGVWTSSNPTQIVVPAGISRVSYDASMLIEVPGGTIQAARTILVASGFASLNPQYQASAGAASESVGRHLSVSYHIGRMIPVQQGDYISFAMVYGGPGTAYMRESAEPAGTHAGTTKINVRMYA